MILGAAAGTLAMRCGYNDGVQSCRGLHLPMRSAPPRRSVVRVTAEAQRSSSQGRMTKKNKVVDSNAVSLNSVLGDTDARDLNGSVLHSGEEESEVVEEEKTPQIQIPLEQLLMQRLKLDKALDEVVGFMAPREKGDIRDVILMSLSFAVLVYISQRLVCLYCVVRHMSSHTF